MNYNRSIEYTEEDKLRALFVGHSVKKVDDDGNVELSNGTRLRLVGNPGCGGCAAGWYELKELNECPNVITNIEVQSEKRTEPDQYGYPPEDGHTYRLFVFADNERINLATFEGDDGNGYYGSGFWVEVQP